jgi:hypothetical protein
VFEITKHWTLHSVGGYSTKFVQHAHILTKDLIHIFFFLLSFTTLDGFWLAQVFLANISCQKHFFQSSTPTIFRSPHILSHHLPLGLPFGLINNVGIQLVTFLVTQCSSILCICPNHPNLFAFTCRTIFCFLIILPNSLLFRNLHYASRLLTGP